MTLPYAANYFYCPMIKMLGDFLTDLQCFVASSILNQCPIVTLWGKQCENGSITQLLNSMCLVTLSGHWQFVIGLSLTKKGKNS
jgi:hypothetical protein